ncbi:MAG: ATPase, T2SS/T4P/T4SS family, partial [Perlucidibaca sp.]
PRLVARIKVMAGMDLAEKRLPQDGRLLDSHDPGGNIRVASLPTLHGEKLCLRLGDTGSAPGLAELGLPEPVSSALEQALARPDGLILITGPTGSGKTTTLYACLKQLNERSRHIATVEDPIERALPGISQTAIQPRIGLDFASVLRALLRQDPDVLMVGEIRDCATAEMAVAAAETGHLVLSTLHTASALDAL